MESIFESQNISIDEFKEEVKRYRDLIDQNLISVKGRISEDDYQELVSNYKEILHECNVSIDNPGVNESVLFSHLNSLRLVLDYTNSYLEENMKFQENGMPENVSEPGNYKDNVPGGYPDQGFDDQTQMIVSEPQGQQINMQNVGPIVAWWRGLNPTTKMAIKLGSVVALIAGGFLAYNKLESHMKKKIEKELESKESEEDVDYDSDELDIKNINW